jgi:hypothetical protein
MRRHQDCQSEKGGDARRSLSTQPSQDCLKGRTSAMRAILEGDVRLQTGVEQAHASARKPAVRRRALSRLGWYDSRRPQALNQRI